MVTPGGSGQIREPVHPPNHIHEVAGQHFKGAQNEQFVAVGMNLQVKQDEATILCKGIERKSSGPAVVT